MSTLANEVAQLRWYHTIELPGGIVTPGGVDTPAQARMIPLPESLASRTCLDVGTADGFWAFEMERRGADRVVAIDIPDATQHDWPGIVDDETAKQILLDDEEHGKGFALAHEALGSKVERVEASIYDLDPEALGQFDFIFIGSLLLHLRDPVGALQALRRLAGGELLSADLVSPVLSAMHPLTPVARLAGDSWPLWWMCNLQGYRRMFTAAGFEIIDAGRLFMVPPGRDAKNFVEAPVGEGLIANTVRRTGEAVRARAGVTHSWVRVRAKA